MKAPPVVEDANMQVTKVKGQSEGLDTEEDKSEADADPEPEQELSRSTQDRSPVSTNRQKPFLQVPPKTYGEIHIHSVLWVHTLCFVTFLFVTMLKMCH